MFTYPWKDISQMETCYQSFHTFFFYIYKIKPSQDLEEPDTKFQLLEFTSIPFFTSASKFYFNLILLNLQHKLMGGVFYTEKTDCVGNFMQKYALGLFEFGYTWLLLTMFLFTLVSLWRQELNEGEVQKQKKKCSTYISHYEIPVALEISLHKMI